MLELASGDTVAGYVPVDRIFDAIPSLMAAKDRDQAVAILNECIAPTPKEATHD